MAEGDDMIAKMRMTLLAVPITFVAGAAFAADAALPEPAPLLPSDSGWTFTIAPYFWMAGMNGDIGQFGLPTVHVDASFSDIMENFDIGAMAVGEARNGKFGVAFDFMYINLSTDVDTPFGVVADNVEVTSKTLTSLAALEYRVLETDTASVDLMAGGRLWWVDTDIDPQGGPGNDLFFSDGDTWVDPIVGAKGRVNLSDNFYLTGWGMVGGFGVSSDFTWDVMASLGYEFSDKISVVGGYRALGVDYSDDGFLFDVVEHGPILGAVFRF